ncbi:alpha/beta hydrolase family protein [Caulobacter segnis]
MRFLPRAAFAAAVLAPAVALAQVAPIAGDWYGTIPAPGLKIPVVAHIKPDGATLLDSPQQGAKDMPATTVLEGGKVTITLKGVLADFDGQLAADGKSIAGQWNQSGAHFKVTLTREPPAAEVRRARPQDPKPPFPYKAEDVSYANPASGLKLAGTLTLPEGAGPFPAVVLITGSGPQDRDETVFDHKPFWVIADALTRKGVAVLRVDDRGMGGSARGPASPTTADFATDVEAGVAFLRGRKEIAGDRVGLLGHSEGGLIAPMVAAKDPKIAFLVLLAAPGVDGARLLMSQGAALEAAMGAPEAYRQASDARRRTWYDIVQSEPDDAKARTKLNLALTEQKMPIDIREQVLALTQPWWRFLLASRPERYLKDIHAPVLALGGSKDLQVPAAENLAAIKAALPAGTDVTVQELPRRNHLFQTTDTGLPNEYGKLEETFAPSALSTLVDWTVAHSKPR